MVWPQHRRCAEGVPELLGVVRRQRPGRRGSAGYEQPGRCRSRHRHMVRHRVRHGRGVRRRAPNREPNRIGKRDHPHWTGDGRLGRRAQLDVGQRDTPQHEARRRPPEGHGGVQRGPQQRVQHRRRHERRARGMFRRTGASRDTFGCSRIAVHGTGRVVPGR